MLPRAGVQSSCQPEEDLAERLVLGQEDDDCGDDRTEECVDRDSRKQERCHGEASANSSDAVHEERGCHGADEREGWQREEEEPRHPCGDGCYCTHRSSS